VRQGKCGKGTFCYDPVAAVQVSGEAQYTDAVALPVSLNCLTYAQRQQCLLHCLLLCAGVRRAPVHSCCDSASVAQLPNNGATASICCIACSHAQVSGEAQYTDDVALPPSTLHAAFVTSVKPHAKLLGVDASAALDMPGGQSRHLLAYT
jgi:hypothetical protein